MGVSTLATLQGSPTPTGSHGDEQFRSDNHGHGMLRGFRTLHVPCSRRHYRQKVPKHLGSFFGYPHRVLLACMAHHLHASDASTNCSDVGPLMGAGEGGRNMGVGDWSGLKRANV